MNEFNTNQVRFKVVIKIIFTGLGKTKNYKTWVKKFPLTSSRFPVTINLARKIYFTDCFSAKRKCYSVWKYTLFLLKALVYAVPRYYFLVSKE